MLNASLNISIGKIEQVTDILEQHKSMKLRAYLALAGSMLALSLAPIFVRWSGAPAMVTSFYRMLIGSIVLTPIALRRVTRNGWPKGKALAFVTLAGLFTALDHSFWGLAVDRTYVANAMLLNSISPLWVAFFAMAVWHEKLKPLFWLALAAVLVGSATVMGGNFSISPVHALGDTLAVISSIFYALYFLALQKGREGLDTLTSLWVLTVVGAACLLVGTQALGMPLTGYPGNTYLVFLAAALVGQLAGVHLVVYALGNLPASVVTPTMVLMPVISALLAIPLAGETLTASQVLGGLVTVAGVYLINVSQGQVELEKSTSVP